MTVNYGITVTVHLILGITVTVHLILEIHRGWSIKCTVTVIRVRNTERDRHSHLMAIAED